MVKSRNVRLGRSCGADELRGGQVRRAEILMLKNNDGEQTGSCLARLVSRRGYMDAVLYMKERRVDVLLTTGSLAAGGRFDWSLLCTSSVLPPARSLV